MSSMTRLGGRLIVRGAAESELIEGLLREVGCVGRVPLHFIK
jgi:hypothetical protein